MGTEGKEDKSLACALAMIHQTWNLQQTITPGTFFLFAGLRRPQRRLSMWNQRPKVSSFMWILSLIKKLGYLQRNLYLAEYCFMWHVTPRAYSNYHFLKLAFRDSSNNFWNNTCFSWPIFACTVLSFLKCFWILNKIGFLKCCSWAVGVLVRIFPSSFWMSQTKS